MKKNIESSQREYCELSRFSSLLFILGYLFGTNNFLNKKISDLNILILKKISRAKIVCGCNACKNSRYGDRRDAKNTTAEERRRVGNYIPIFELIRMHFPFLSFKTDNPGASPVYKCRCPLCNKEECTLYITPRVNKFLSTHCGAAGDPVSFYCASYKVSPDLACFNLYRGMDTRPE